MARDIDVVVLGATALTGRQMCRYLTARAPELGLSWAAAGRDAARVAGALDAADATADAVLTADVTDLASLRRLAARGRVLVNLVGPYARSAADVVAACIAEGTHYVDLTGETLFLRRLIERFDAAARTAGVKVVQPCGFESLPVDLLLGALLDAAGGADLRSVDVEFAVQQLPRGLRPGDAVSGGTVRSLLEMVDEPDAADVFDPALLVTDDGRAAEVRRVSPLQVRPRLAGDGAALAPLLPAPTINPPVVQRSLQLLDRPPLRYREGSRVLSGPFTLPLGAPVAAAASGAFVAARALTRAPAPARRAAVRALGRVLPDSGEGPRPDRVQGWRWRLAAVGRTATGRFAATVTGTGHPGYLTTAHMAAEAGLILAAGRQLPDRAGLLTPLAALGTASLAGFAAAGLDFDVPAPVAVNPR